MAKCTCEWKIEEVTCEDCQGAGVEEFGTCASCRGTGISHGQGVRIPNPNCPVHKDQI